jgi:GAF domain-containing protein
VNCTYLGETLGVMVLFRDHKTPFSDEDVAALKTVSPLFSLALARAVKGMELAEGGGTGAMDEDEGRREDPADWWKDGEEPPF